MMMYRFTFLILLVEIDSNQTEPFTRNSADLPDDQKADVEEDDKDDDDVDDEYGFDPSLHVYQPDSVLVAGTETDEGF